MKNFNDLRGKKKMDERTAEALAYRIKQLENQIQRSMSFASEAKVHLEAVQGILKNTKWDFESLRSFCK